MKSAFVPALVHAGYIAQKPLDGFLIYNIPSAFRSGTTTIRFPTETSGLSARSRSSQNADFLMSFTPGYFYFTGGHAKTTHP